MRRREIEEMCSIPIRAKYTVDRKTGEIIDYQPEMVELPAKLIADFILAQFGSSPQEVEQNG